VLLEVGGFEELIIERVRPRLRREGADVGLKWEDARAECAVRDSQFVVRKGSTGRPLG
jgi:hypothetical protein